LRSREVRQRQPEPIAGESEAPSSESVAAGERELDAVFAALDRLPDEQRLALALVAIEGKSYAEAAEVLDVPVGTIMSRIARARKQLLQFYRPASRREG
jgi:RNA polymerase sigma-70 factor (ECF subfamily)